MLDKPSYLELKNHFEKNKLVKLIDLFKEDSNRADKFSLTYENLFFDFSKNNVTEETLSLLIKLAEESDLDNKINAMFNGDKVNNTENRAVLHTALRATNNKQDEVSTEIHNVLERMQKFSDKVRSGEHKGYTGKSITDIVNIGIGGSDLGPVLACQALKPYRSNLNIHFVSSIDGYQILDILSNLNPETTLFIIASKTFTTQETMINAGTAREWFLKSANNVDYIKYHFVASSTNSKAVEAFGIDTDNMFEFWDYVGGRYSLFSSIGLSIILYIGFENFSRMLDGARAMDTHFRETKDFRQNLPVLLGLIGIWYVNFYNYSTHIISPYNTRLSSFPAYIQQLDMESNGKSVNRAGEAITYKTCPVIWGGHGINGQHAYYQLLHQGTSIYPMDILVALSDKHTLRNHNDILVANAFAQAEAFMCGTSFNEARSELINNGVNPTDADFLAKHKVFAGNRPTNLITLPEISPYYLGMLIALYEHKTFTQGIIWNINSFDQMGVELGKQLAKTICNDMATKVISQHDSSTHNLIKNYIFSN
ncbi:MAG: glucose-6-phosphate isomerase [Neisseriaceae bacterium]